MNSLADNRLVKTFAELAASGAKTVMPFFTAGYPSLDATRAILDELTGRGVRVCELGIPFSDPIADGPTIQASYTEALACGVTSRKIFEMVGEYRASGGTMALVAMVSYSIVYRHGVEQYIAAAATAGLDGLIVPDLSLEEAGPLEALASRGGLANVMLVSPNTSAARQREIAGHSRGFTYFISVAGITGERDKLPEATIAAVAQLREHTDTPVCVGFGISKPETVAAVCEVADGAIVGSAIVHRITDSKDKPPAELAADVGRFVGELMAPLQ